MPAYGTVMLPLESTIWFGSVTKLPGRAPASLGTNSPPGGSKIVTLTMVTDAKRDPPRQWCTGLRCVGPASSFCRSVIFAAALVYKTRISRSRASGYSDSSCGGEDNGARPDHHRNNSSTRSGGALVCRAHRFYHPARVEYLLRPPSARCQSVARAPAQRG